MAAIMLPPCQLAAEQPLVHRRHLRGGVIALHIKPPGAQQRVDAAGVYGGHEAAFVVQPFGVALLRNAVADESEARRTQSDQLIGVDRKVTGRLGAERGF